MNMNIKNDLSSKFVKPSERKTHVGPWKNQLEFELVYNWIFSVTSDNEKRQRACLKMTMWKMRRLNFTQAAILSTIVLLEVQIEDQTKKNNIKHLQILYASAFTRFLNYMSSITQTKSSNSKSMYDSAKELDIEPFIVDLRHLCAHGQVMPSIKVLSSASEYCMKWLKDNFWDLERQHLNDVDAKNIKQNGTTQFYQNINELLTIYDSTAEVQFQGFDYISSEVQKLLPKHTFYLLNKYSNSKNELSLKEISRTVLRELSSLVKSERRIKNVSYFYIKALTRMNFFFKWTVQSKGLNNESEEKKIIKFFKPLLGTITLCSFIEELFHTLIVICENEFETISRRKGASFWANKIAQGFQILKDFTKFCKTNKELAVFVEKTGTKPILKNKWNIYLNFSNTNADSMLIFPDYLKHPPSLILTRDFIKERIKKANEYNKELLESCLFLVMPNITESDLQILKECMKNYYSIEENSISQKDVTFEGYFKSVPLTDIPSYGKWSEVSGCENFNQRPLGKTISE